MHSGAEGVGAWGGEEEGTSDGTAVASSPDRLDKNVWFKLSQST